MRETIREASRHNRKVRVQHAPHEDRHYWHRDEERSEVAFPLGCSSCLLESRPFHNSCANVRDVRHSRISATSSLLTSSAMFSPSRTRPFLLATSTTVPSVSRTV